MNLSRKASVKDAERTRQLLRKLQDPESSRKAAIRAAKKLSVGSTHELFRQVATQLRKLSPSRSLEPVDLAFGARNVVLMAATAAIQTFAMSNFCRSVVRHREGGGSDPAIASASLLLMRQCEAIEMLCIAGLDTQAKTILRSAFETVDLLIVMQHDPDLRVEYVGVESDADARAFWGKYLFRGRMMRTSNRIFEEKYPMSLLGFNFADWKNIEYEFLSGSTHPTHSAGFMGVFGNTFSHYADSKMISPFTLGAGDPHLGTFRTSKSLLTQVFRLLAMYNDEDIIDFGDGSQVRSEITVGDISILISMIYVWIDTVGAFEISLLEDVASGQDGAHSEPRC